jgi:hypothetical protein
VSPAAASSVGKTLSTTFDGRLMSLLIAAARFAHLTVGKACAAPRWQAILGRGWWAFDGHQFAAK